MDDSESTICDGRAGAARRLARPEPVRGRSAVERRTFGRRALWHDLLDAGLVDELDLMVGSVVLGGGTPLFASGRQTSLEPLGTQTFEDSSNVLVRYTPRP